jgi:hypothetical protein
MNVAELVIVLSAFVICTLYLVQELRALRGQHQTFALTLERNTAQTTATATALATFSDATGSNFTDIRMELRSLGENLADLKMDLHNGLETVSSALQAPHVIRNQTDHMLGGIFKVETGSHLATGFFVANSTDSYLLTVRHVFEDRSVCEGVALHDIASAHDAAKALKITPANSTQGVLHSCVILSGGSSGVAGTQDWALLDCPGLRGSPAFTLSPDSCQLPTMTENTVVSLQSVVARESVVNGVPLLCR